VKVIVQNIAAEYKDEGAGPVMLMLHGWQDTLHTFDDVVPFLSTDWRVVRLDLPGFGATEGPDRGWYLDDYVQFVYDFLQKLDIQPSVIVGHSMGGRIVIKGSAAKVLPAGKIVLIASAGVARRTTVRNAFIAAAAKTGGIVSYIPPLLFWRQMLRRKLYDRLGSDYLKAGPLKETFLNIIREDLSSFAAIIKVPALLVWGANDTMTPLKEGRRLALLIRNSILKIIPGAGHMVHRKHAREVADHIREFALS